MKNTNEIITILENNHSGISSSVGLFRIYNIKGMVFGYSKAILNHVVYGNVAEKFNINGEEVSKKLFIEVLKKVTN